MYTLLENKIDHQSSIFGIPPNPPGYEQFPTSMNLRIASGVVDMCFERVKREAQLRMERKFKKEGLEGFKAILNAESILEELAKIS